MYTESYKNLTPAKYAKEARELAMEFMREEKRRLRGYYLSWGFIEMIACDSKGERIDNIDPYYFDKLTEVTGKSIEDIAKNWLRTEYYAISVRTDIWENQYECMQQNTGYYEYDPGEWEYCGYAKVS